MRNAKKFQSLRKNYMNKSFSLREMSTSNHGCVHFRFKKKNLDLRFKVFEKYHKTINFKGMENCFVFLLVLRLEEDFRMFLFLDVRILSKY